MAGSEESIDGLVRAYLDGICTPERILFDWRRSDRKDGMEVTLQTIERPKWYAVAFIDALHFYRTKHDQRELLDLIGYEVRHAIAEINRKRELDKHRTMPTVVLPRVVDDDPYGVRLRAWTEFRQPRAQPKEKPQPAGLETNELGEVAP